MHHTSFLLFILLSHHHLPRTTTAEDPPETHYCGWIKTVTAKQVETHYSFLRNSSSSSTVRLYHSVWSSTAGRAPLGCAWSDDAAAVEHYLALCADGSSGFSQQNHHDDEPFDLSLLDGMCVDSASPTKANIIVMEDGRGTVGQGRRLVRSVDHQGEVHSITGAHRRVKRGFIVPGTLWCGSGNKAPSYADLGVFSDTDSCCREHDQCKDTILSFQSSYGVFNRNIFTMSHCDCDKKFRSCLAAANDSIADVVGYTFFNVLKLNCFEFSQRLQCTQRNWFGRCEENKMAPYAVVHHATQYGGHGSSSNTTHINISTVITASFSTQGRVTTTGGQEENSSTSQQGSVSLSGRVASSITSSAPLGSHLTSGTIRPTPMSTSARMTSRGLGNVSPGGPHIVTPSPPRSTRLNVSNGLTWSPTQQDTSANTGGQEENSSTTQQGSVSLSGSLASSITSSAPLGSHLTSGTARPTPMSMATTMTSTGLGNVPTRGPRIVTPSPPRSNRLNVSNGLTWSPTQQDTSANTGKPLPCELFKDLDGCKFKIFPQQMKYGFHNQESRILYHCNCTTRLFQSLAQQEDTTVIQALLLDYVSDSCFLPQAPCTNEKTCSTAVLVKLGAHSQLKKSSSGMVETGRPLEAIRLTTRKQPNSRRAKRKDRPVRLQKLCMKMSSSSSNTTGAKQPSKNTKVYSTEVDR